MIILETEKRSCHQRHDSCHPGAKIRVVAYRNCGLSFKENQSTCQTKPSNYDADLSPLDAGGNDGPRDPITPPLCTTARDDRPIVRMAVIDRAAISRTITQQSVTHHSVFAHVVVVTNAT
ncbi:hypothetical protein TNCV_4047871 [Trichonephila clavipes]|nr:hypothetical protein TNCV_4047871 [Trichonephila clavipes]